MSTLCIPSRFCGPPGTANGGYLAGSLAAVGLGQAAAVRLHAPIPLAVELQVSERDGRRELLHEGKLLATAQPATLELSVPAAPDFDAASRASRAYIGFSQHAYPGCFVCGTARGAGDGMRIYAGPTTDGAMVASPWIPDHTLADAAGAIPLEFLWAAIDCPGYFAARDDGQPMLLAEITARVDRTSRVGAACVVIGWRERVDGRKHWVGTALFDRDGERLAAARALWIAPRPPQQPA
jgi:hypothetical protein